MSTKPLVRRIKPTPKYEPLIEDYWIHTNNQVKPCKFNIWKNFYIKDYNINIAEKIYITSTEIPYASISIGEILNIADNSPEMQSYLRRICMKNGLTGRKPNHDIKEYIEKQLDLGNTWLLRKIQN